jgi:hypothetical protein
MAAIPIAETVLASSTAWTRVIATCSKNAIGHPRCAGTGAPARTSVGVVRWGMATSKVRALAEQIRALPDADQQALAQEVLPVLLSTRAGLEAIDRALTTLSDEELDALIERARAQADLPETTAAAVIGEAVRAVRAKSRS